MAIYFDGISIERFRGIKGLQISDIKDINIIAGNNNVGKTSILEAIALLKNPYNFYDILKVAQLRQRPNLKSLWYDNFIAMFPRDKKHIKVEAYKKDNVISVELCGIEKDMLVESKKTYSRYSVYKNNEEDNGEVMGFDGELHACDYDGSQYVPIEYSYLSNPVEYNVKESNRYIEYVPPGAHLQGNVFSRIVRNDSYKEVCISLLQLFDENIVDLLYLSGEKTMRAVEYVKHRKLGVMPLATYGDGIKRVLSLANSIAMAVGGILMIDEVETSINHKYYQEIFTFLIKACQQYKIQLFVTTHNIEAIDAILGTQHYERNIGYDPISVVTFRKDTDTSQVYSRSLSGRKAFEDREKFQLEVRL